MSRWERNARRAAAARTTLRLLYSAAAEGLCPPGTVVREDDHLETGVTCDATGVLSLLAALHLFDPRQPPALRIDGLNGPAGTGDPLSLVEGPLKAWVAEALGPEGAAPDWSALAEEIADSVNNEMLAVEAQLASEIDLQTLARQTDNLFDLLRGGPLPDRHDADSLVLQIGSFSGHRTHPATKMRLRSLPSRRLALTPAEVTGTAPEFAPDVALPLYGVRRTCATASVSAREVGGYGSYFARGFPDAWANWTAGLRRLGLHTDQYWPLPVHPLQAHEIADRFGGALARGDLIAVPGAVIVQRPTLSYRTLTPVARPEEPQVKTALTMQMTSVVRTLAPARAFNAPVFSDLIAVILDGAPDIAARLRVLHEPASVYWGRDRTETSADYRDGAHAAAVFKDNPASLMRTDEIRIPLNTLFERSAVSGRPVIVDVMAIAGIDGALGAARYFADYAGVVLTGDLGLLVRYGIGLESHQQNLDLVFDFDGRPRASVYRDINGGLEMAEPLLLANGFDVRGECHPVRRGLHDSIAVPLRQFTHTTLMAHLIPMAMTIAQAYRADPLELFAVIRRLIAEGLADSHARHRARLRDPAVFDASLKAVHDGILRTPLRTKSLLTMRARQSQQMVFSTLPNPLAG